MAKQKPIKIEPLVMSTKMGLEACLNEALKHALKKDTGVSFQYDDVIVIVYRPDPTKAPKDITQHYLRIYEEKIGKK